MNKKNSLKKDMPLKFKNPLISKKEYFNKKSNKNEKIELLDHQKNSYASSFHPIYQVLYAIMVLVQVRP